MTLKDFRVIKESKADYELTIQWYGTGCKGVYKAWLINEFNNQTNKDKEFMIDKWVKKYAPEHSSRFWYMTKLN